MGEIRSMNVLLDINVVLDVFLNRSEFLADSAAVVQANHEGRLIAHVSAASLPTIFYIVRRNAGLERARLVVIECLNSFHIVPVARSTLELACTLPAPDFEDNLQMACGIEAQMDALVTRDPTGYPSSSVPVMLPAQAMAQLAPKPPGV